MLYFTNISMKLQEFFDTQKNTSYTDIDKLNLYQSILYKKNKRVWLKRTSFVHAKYFIYTMIFVVLMIGSYGVYFMNDGGVENGNRFAIKSNTNNTAQADYIAQVIDAKGNFFIEHNGILLTTNKIGNGDTILLKENTQLVFEINSGTQSKIIWPAKLVIQKTNIDNYKLNLIYGNFIQMEGKEEKAQTIEVAINDIVIKQQDKSQPLNFKFIKNGEDKIFQNNGANIVVTKNNGEEKATTISKQQVVAIQDNDIKIFANIDKFTKAVQEKNVSQTFSLAQKPTNSGASEKETTLLLSILNSTENINGTAKEEITRSISSVVLSGQKSILDFSQYEKITANLYEWVYTSELNELEKAFIEWNEDDFNASYKKIEGKIQTIYQIFTIPYTRQAGDPIQMIEGLKSATKNIQEIMTNKWNIPGKYIEYIQSINKTLNTISKQWYKSDTTHQAPSTGEVVIEK